MSNSVSSVSGSGSAFALRFNFGPAKPAANSSACRFALTQSWCFLAGGERVGRKQVARLMRELGIEGVTRRRFRTGTTKQDAGAKAAPDLVNRDFSADGRDELWVADITQARAGAGWLYLAVVLDAWSQWIVGWALVSDALKMAISTRQPKGPVIHHSDRGSQYTSLAFGQRCQEAGVVQSMGSVEMCTTTRCARASSRRLSANSPTGGGCGPWPRRGEKSSASWRTLTTTRRLHLSLGYRSPANLEKLHHAA